MTAMNAPVEDISMLLEPVHVLGRRNPGLVLLRLLALGLVVVAAVVVEQLSDVLAQLLGVAPLVEARRGDAQVDQHDAVDAEQARLVGGQQAAVEAVVALDGAVGGDQALFD